MSYIVQTFDVCVSGFERMRCQDEFILTAHIDATTTGADLRTAWIDDLQVCDRGDNFDYDEARAAIESYCRNTVSPLFNNRRNPFNLEHGREDIGIYDDGDSVTAFLFIAQPE